MHVFGENSDKEHIQESAACGFSTVQEDTKMGHGEKIISCLEDQFEFFGRRRFGHVQARAKRSRFVLQVICLSKKNLCEFCKK